MQECFDGLEGVSPEMLRRLADVLRTLAHPARLRMLACMEHHGPTAVRELAGRVGVSQSTASQHLNLLRRLQLIDSERHGRRVCYSVADGRVLAILACLREQAQHYSD
ncbi:MAG: ArsR/SmtB family transcription factor [Kiritimatiellia bacterium]|nr:metalloregulator ArsR/SmtB family transcription factor [Lentisphaerota bacterium]